MPLVYRRCRVVAVSRSTADEMRRQLGWTGPVGMLANGADLPPLGTGNPAAKDPDRVAVLGRLVAHKRVDLVIIAVDALRTEYPRLQLDIIGKGPERPALEDLAARLGLANRVNFHGFVDDDAKAALLARASVHVCASDAEGWGQAVIDAAGYGVPTVARDVPGLRDSIRSGESGWLVPDSDDLEEVGRRLTAQLREALAEAEAPVDRALRFKACQAWAHQFDWSEMRRQALAVVISELHNSQATTRPASTVPAVQHRPREERVAVMGGTTCVE